MGKTEIEHYVRNPHHPYRTKIQTILRVRSCILEMSYHSMKNPLEHDISLRLSTNVRSVEYRPCSPAAAHNNDRYLESHLWTENSTRNEVSWIHLKTKHLHNSSRTIRREVESVEHVPPIPMLRSCHHRIRPCMKCLFFFVSSCFVLRSYLCVCF